MRTPPSNEDEHTTYKHFYLFNFTMHTNRQNTPDQNYKCIEIKVFGETEVELKCLLLVGKGPYRGAWPFLYRSREGPTVQERERGKRKTMEETPPELRRPSPCGRVLWVL
jgi:hypothetical protein